MKKPIRRTPAEVFKQWIKALRKGTYKQTRGKLRSGDGFCCLGVLCDLAAKDGGRQWGDSNAYAYEYGTKVHSLGNDTLQFLGLTRNNQQNLTDLNDLGCKSFPEIADLIETKIAPRALARLSKRKLK